MHLSFDIGSGKFQGRGLPVEAYRARVVHLLQASDSAMLVHHSSDPLMPWSKIYFLASHHFCFPSLNWASSSLSNWACTFLASARRRYARLGEIWTYRRIASGKWSRPRALSPTRAANVTVESAVAINASE